MGGVNNAIPKMGGVNNAVVSIFFNSNGDAINQLYFFVIYYQFATQTYYFFIVNILY
jgi:hypothetical protein